MRDFQRDEVKMHQSFRPGDIVRARVIQGVGSGGTSRDQSVLLSTAEEQLGVVFARSAQTGTLLIPRSGREFESVKTHSKELRKEANVLK